MLVLVSSYPFNAHVCQMGRTGAGERVQRKTETNNQSLIQDGKMEEAERYTSVGGI